MKLLFDQNLSFKLFQQLADLFPGSSQVRLLALDQADDRSIWQHAKVNGFTLVSQDSSQLPKRDDNEAMGTLPQGRAASRRFPRS